VLEPGAEFATHGAALHADAEVAVVVGTGYAAALELVDLSNAAEGAETVVATNIFHRAVAFGAARAQLPASGSLVVNGVVRASGAVPDVAARMRSAEQVLATVGERFEEGDRVITGSVVQVPVQAGDEVTADFGALGRVSVRLA
jgi:2-keto-4-pentenoate hydratase